MFRLARGEKSGKVPTMRPQRQLICTLLSFAAIAVCRAVVSQGLSVDPVPLTVCPARLLIRAGPEPHKLPGSK